MSHASASTSVSTAAGRVPWTLARQVLLVSLVLPTLATVGVFGFFILTIPPVVAFLVVQLACAAFVAWRGNKWASLVGGIALLAFAALNLPFLGPELARPDHGLTFVIANLAMATGIVGFVAGIAAFREGRSGRFATPAWGAPGAAAALVVAGLVLGITFSGVATRFGPVAGTGTVALTPEATATLDIAEGVFSPDPLTIPAGKIVKLTITNGDGELHTFSIDDLGLAADLPAGKTVDVWLKADAGTYQIYCAPHSSPTDDGREGMVGTLTVA